MLPVYVEVYPITKCMYKYNLIFKLQLIYILYRAFSKTINIFY